MEHTEGYSLSVRDRFWKASPREAWIRRKIVKPQISALTDDASRRYTSRGGGEAEIHCRRGCTSDAAVAAVSEVPISSRQFGSFATLDHLRGVDGATTTGEAPQTLIDLSGASPLPELLSPLAEMGVMSSGGTAPEVETSTVLRLFPEDKRSGSKLGTNPDPVFKTRSEGAAARGGEDLSDFAIKGATEEASLAEMPPERGGRFSLPKALETRANFDAPWRSHFFFLAFAMDGGEEEKFPATSVRPVTVVKRRNFRQPA